MKRNTIFNACQWFIRLVFLVGNVSAQTTVIDTLDGHFKNATLSNYGVLMGPSMVGYLAGYSYYEDKADMQLFDEKYGVTSGGVITELQFAFATRTGTNLTNKYIVAKIWSDNNGVPDSVLASVKLFFSDIQISDSLIELTGVKFPTPVEIPDNKKFWAGFSMPLVNSYALKIDGDTVALYTSSDSGEGDEPGVSGDFPDANTHTFLQRKWGVYESFHKAWKVDVALAVFPIIQFTTGLNEKNSISQLQLHQNTPNPSDKSTYISYELPQQDEVNIEIYDLLGRKQLSVYKGFQNKGTYKESIDISHLPEGMYFYTLVTNSAVLSKKMLINK